MYVEKFFELENVRTKKLLFSSVNFTQICLIYENNFKNPSCDPDQEGRKFPDTTLTKKGRIRNPGIKYIGT